MKVNASHIFFIFVLCAGIMRLWSQENTDIRLKQTPQWLVPEFYIQDGGPGKDGIPSIDAPQFVPASRVTFLNNTDLVIGINIAGKARAYPIKILNWHEIVNDAVSDLPVAVTYCPLTGSAICWNRKINGMPTTFGVSGLLYNSNLIAYDRHTNTYWSQMLMKAIKGEQKGKTIQTIPTLETTWKTWKKLYPNSQVLSPKTGFIRHYSYYPYGDYLNSRKIYFPVAHQNSQLHPKARVLGIKGKHQTMVFSIENFKDNLELIHFSLDGKAYIIIGSKSLNIAIAFENRLDTGAQGMMFTSVKGNLPAVMKDDSGNIYSIFGEVIAGPQSGERLKPARAFISYWFAWVAFYPDVQIWKR